LTVSMNRLADLPTIIDPLTAPDMPRVIWFRSARIDRAPGIAELLALGDKIIVDSMRPGAPAFADMRVLAGAGYIVADLAWTRLTRIRELLAQLLAGRDLASIRAVMILYCGADPAPAAKYIQAWLRSEMTSATVDLRKDGSEGRGEIKAIQIEPDLNVRVSSNCAEYETGALHQRANLTSCAEHELLSEELSIMSHDPAFERALQRMTIWTPRS
jgi:glucose-6-phosphate dehydrogenase assembly protein OpcA